MVSCIPPCKHVSKCAPNYSRWPFDRQNCTIHIGTWVDSGDEIDFRLMKTVVTDDDLSSQNFEWRLIQATYKRDAGNYTNTKVTYPSLTFSFLIERHSASHTVFVLVPAIGMDSLPLDNIRVNLIYRLNGKRGKSLLFLNCVLLMCIF